MGAVDRSFTTRYYTCDDGTLVPWIKAGEVAAWLIAMAEDNDVFGWRPPEYSEGLRWAAGTMLAGMATARSRYEDGTL